MEVVMLKGNVGYGFAVVLTLLGIAAAACTAPAIGPAAATEDDDSDQTAAPKKKTTTTTDSGAVDNTPATTDTPPTDDAGTIPIDPPITPPPTGSCGSSPDAESCFQCCDPGQATMAAEDAFGRCACQSPGICASACSTSYCAGRAPTAACDNCLANAAQCEQVADTACTGACQTAVSCFESSGCYDKQ